LTGADLSDKKIPKGSMASRYGSSSCRYCHERINVGDIIRSGDKGWGHHLCVVRPERESKKIKKLDDNAEQANSRRWQTNVTPLTGGDA
jgi:hypothetical protein